MLAYQLENYQEDLSVDENMAKLTVNSLKLVEKEFQIKIQQLNIDKFITNEYLNKLDKVNKDKDLIIWAKIFVYMMSGMHKQAL